MARGYEANSSSTHVDASPSQSSFFVIPLRLVNGPAFLPSSKSHQKSGPFAPPALLGLNAPIGPSDSRRDHRLGVERFNRTNFSVNRKKGVGAVLKRPPFHRVEPAISQ